LLFVKHYVAQQYEKFHPYQELHNAASNCLKEGNVFARVDLTQLATYMLKAVCGELSEYCLARKEAFLRRPDACSYAFNILSLATNESQIEHVSPTTPITLSSSHFSLWETGAAVDALKLENNPTISQPNGL
jgi:hypothetical protein